MSKRTDRDENGGSTEAKRPVHTIGPFNAGGSLIESSIWENEVKDGQESRSVFQVTVQRAYYHGDGWKRTKSFRPQDLPHLVETIRLAYLWCQEQSAKK